MNQYSVLSVKLIVYTVNKGGKKEFDIYNTLNDILLYCCNVVFLYVKTFFSTQKVYQNERERQREEKEKGFLREQEAHRP